MEIEPHINIFSYIENPMQNVIGMALLLSAMVSSALAQDISTLAARYPELKVKQADGLPIRIAREDWAAAKQLVSQDPEWRKWLDYRKRALDSWILRFHDRPEWIAGTRHELIDPKTHAPVKWSPDMPQPSGDGKLRQAWVSYARSYNFDQILEAARIYRLTGDQRYAEWAAQQLDFYAQNYSRWPLQTRHGNARMMGGTLDEATGSMQLVEATRLIEKAVSPERLAVWRDDLFLPMIASFRNYAHRGYHNISLWLAVATAIVGYRFDDPKLVAEALDGPYGVRALMKKGVTADFLWFEGSFSYNDYVLTALKPLFIQASVMGDASTLRQEMLIAQNMLLAATEFRFPDGKRPAPGDDRNARAPALNVGLHAFLRRVLPTSAGLMEAAQHKSWDSLIDAPETYQGSAEKTYPRPAEKLPPVVTQNFEAERMAVLKADDWQLFMHYGQLTVNHTQQEALNYELYWKSTPISLDQGTLAYGSPLHLNYFRRGAAHNVPLVDGAGQEGWALGKVVFFDAAIPAIEVSQPAYWKNASATRSLEIRNGVVFDKVLIRAKGQRRLGLVFNSECKFDLGDVALGPSSPSRSPVGPGFEYWSGVSRRAAPAQWSAKLICNGARIDLSVKASMPHALFHGSVPATPVPSRREAIYLELTGKEANFDMQFRAEP